MQCGNILVFSLHVLHYIILTDELLTTVRALVVLLFNIVLILRTLVHVADHLATALLNTLGEATLFLSVLCPQSPYTRLCD